MIHLYKSHYSIGKSILTIPQIFTLEKEEVILVEDSMSGLRESIKESKKTEKRLVFGMRINTKSDNQDSKVIFFAKDAAGIDSLRRIYTKAFTEGGGVYHLNKEELCDVKVAIPFYDSYIHKNLHHFGSHELDLEGLDPIYFEEDNNHVYDLFIKNAIKNMGIETVKAKSVYYEKPEDAVALQFYKSVCNRRQGKSPTIERPELEHFCSEKFCLTST